MRDRHPGSCFGLAHASLKLAQFVNLTGNALGARRLAAYEAMHRSRRDVLLMASERNDFILSRPRAFLFSR